MKERDSLATVGQRLWAPNYNPRMNLVCRARGGGMGVSTTYTVDSPGCGGRNVLDLVRRYLERRLRASESQEKDFARVGTESPEDKDFSATAPQKEFAGAIQSIPATPEVWASRQRPLNMGEVRTRQCILGELRPLVTVSRPDNRARFARLSAEVNSLQGCGIRRTNDPLKTSTRR